MYIVRDKKSGRIIHVNPAPLHQKLKEREVYFKFDPGKMEIGKTSGPLPEYFDINENGMIVEVKLPDLVKRGLVKLEPYQKISGNRIVDKSVAELVKEGLLNLDPPLKSGKGKSSQNTLAELPAAIRKLESEIRKIKRVNVNLKKQLQSLKARLKMRH